MAVPAAEAAVPKKKAATLKLKAVKTATATTIAPSSTDQFLTATAACPAGRKAVAGGFTTIQAGGGFSPFVTDSLMTSDQRGWTVSAFTNGAGRGVTAIAYCRKVPKRIVDETAVVFEPAGDNAASSVVATCTGKRKLLSGGFSGDRGPGLTDFAQPGASYETGPKSWTYTAISSGPASATRTLTAHAYCTKGVKSATALTNSTTAPVAIQGDATGSATGCGGKKPRLFGGGFAVSPFGAGVTPFPVVTDSLIVGGVWAVTFRNFGTAGSVTSTAQALCGQK
jgi:hypothetical protein